MTDIRHVDIAIVGGGMVGTALAAALGQGPYSVALIDERVPAIPNGEPQLRVSALSLASQRLLAALGAWPAIEACGRAQAYDGMQVWDRDDAADIRFDAGELGLATLGWIVENDTVQAALYAQITDDTQVSLLHTTVQHLAYGNDRVHLQLADGQALSAGLVVGADGHDSIVRAFAGITLRGRDYQQQAVVAVVSTEHPHDGVARQRFLPGGPLAFLPLYDGRCSIVWTLPTAEAKTVQSLPPAEFCTVLGDAFGHKLGAVTGCGPRAAFPLRLRQATHYVASRIALVGDAAHVVHPLAGQGVNLGFLDAAALAEVLLDHRRDPGYPPVLRRYERWRRGHNQLMATALDGIERLFATDVGPIPRIRALGLSMTNRLGPVKAMFARQAMGLGGDLPRLVRDGSR